MRVLEHLLLYAEYQFGSRNSGVIVRGETYRERADGQKISNWVVEINTLHYIHLRLIDIISSNELLKYAARDDKMFPHVEKSLSLLNLWIINLDKVASNRGERLNNEQMNYLLQELYGIEQTMGTVTMNRDQFDVADGHCQRSVTYAKRYVYIYIYIYVCI
jgi:hypothetical protein